MRWTLIAALAAAGPLAAGCAGAPLSSADLAHRQASPQAAPSGAVVAWRDAPAPRVPPILPSPAPLPARYPPCSASQLTGLVSEGGAASQTLFYVATFTNRSAAGCTLQGWPRAVEGIGPQGARPLGQRGDLPFGLAKGAANLPPRGRAELGIGVADACARPSPDGAVFSAVRFLLPGGGAVALPVHAPRWPFMVRCGMTYGPFGTRPTNAPASPLDSLTATTSGADRLVAGTVGRYVVTLHNPSAHAVRLDPCPSYEELLATATVSDVETYYLNCAAAPLIPAHGAIRYAMRIRVPREFGETKFVWRLQNFTVGTGGEVMVATAR